MRGPGSTRFEVGDRVRYVGKLDPAFVGTEGTVIGFHLRPAEQDYYEVRWDRSYDERGRQDAWEEDIELEAV